MSRKKRLAEMARATGGYGIYPWGLGRLGLSLPAEKVLVRILNWKHDEFGIGYPSLGRACGLSRWQAYAALGELEERGLVIRLQKPDGSPRMRGRAPVRAVDMAALGTALGVPPTATASTEDQPAPSAAPAPPVDHPVGSEKPETSTPAPAPEPYDPMLTDAILANISASALMAAFWAMAHESAPGDRELVQAGTRKRYPTLGHDHALTVWFIRRYVPRMLGGRTTLEYLTNATVRNSIEPFRLDLPAMLSRSLIRAGRSTGAKSPPVADPPATDPIQAILSEEALAECSPRALMSAYEDMVRPEHARHLEDEQARCAALGRKRAATESWVREHVPGRLCQDETGPLGAARAFVELATSISRASKA